MTYDFILTEKEAGIGFITINRPAALNALNTGVLEQLKQAALKMQADREIRVLIITGAGDKSFVAGADIAEMAWKDPQGGREFAMRGHDTFRTLELLEKPVIAAINGFALGGGCELAMACDIRIAAEEARFGQPEVGLGIIPGFCGTQRLTRLCGMGTAKMLIMSARQIKAAEALRIGLVDMVVPYGQLLVEAKKLAGEIAAKSPNAVRIAKQAINASYEIGLAAGIECEIAKFGECFSSPEQKEGMSAFLEKRPAKFF